MQFLSVSTKQGCRLSEFYHNEEDKATGVRTRRVHGLHPQVIFWVEDVVGLLTEHGLSMTQGRCHDSY